MTNKCKNCYQHFEGNFCPNCGQTIHTHEINFKSILHEIQHSLLHVDKGVLFTTKELFSRPGHTIREYIDGKRVKHFKPIAYILVLSTIYTILAHTTHQDTYFDKILQGITDGSNDKSSKNLNILVGIFEWMKNHYAYATLILIPITSIASCVAFLRANYNYFQHLILNAFIAGQKTVVMLVMIPIAFIFKNDSVTNAIDLFAFLLGICLTFWTYFQFFYSTKSYKRILLTILSYLLMIVLFVGSLFIIAKIAKILD